MIQRGHRDFAGGDFDEVAVRHVLPVGVVVVGFAGQDHTVRAAQDGQRVPPHAVASMREPLAANMFSRARGSAAAISAMVSPSASRPRSKMTAASIALSQTDSACDVAGSTARSTIPLCDNNHCPSVNGAVALTSIGMPTVAERTAATTQWLRRCRRDGLEGHITPQRQLAAPAPGRGAIRRSIEKADAPTVRVQQTMLLAARRVGLHPQPERRVEHQRGDRDVGP